MNRASLMGFVASLSTLLGAGCGPEVAPPPAADTLYVDPVTATTNVFGFAWDPEAFFLNAKACGPMCPMPMTLSDSNPLFNTAVVQGATVRILDPQAGAPVGTEGQPTGPEGHWRVDGLPGGRMMTPFFIVSTGTGSLPTPPPGSSPLPAVPPAKYLPTLSGRPLYTMHSACYYQEAAHASDKGVLEAVAKYRTARGQVTTVEDLINPARFSAVSVFWVYEPTHMPNMMKPNALHPAAGTTLEVSAGSKYHIDWKEPGSLPAEAAQSTRGFYVVDGAMASPIGVTVVLVPAGYNRPTVTYTPVDTMTMSDPMMVRPWRSMPLELPAIAGQVSLTSLQMHPGGPPMEDNAMGMMPPFFCPSF